MTEQFAVELVPLIPTPEVVAAARHVVKILFALSPPDLNNICTAVSLALVQAIGNMNFKTQADRDMIPDIIAQLLKRNLALADENDRRSGSRA